MRKIFPRNRIGRKKLNNILFTDDRPFNNSSLIHNGLLNFSRKPKGMRFKRFLFVNSLTFTLNLWLYNE